jgi:hypothetical protein
MQVTIYCSLISIPILAQQAMNLALLTMGRKDGIKVWNCHYSVMRAYKLQLDSSQISLEREDSDLFIG